MKPFLKWAGNKLPIIDQIKHLLPAGKRLIDPFVGGGAVFLNTEYAGYLLGDANRDLINVYWQLQNRTNWFIARCKALFDPALLTKDAYYAKREEFKKTRSPVLVPYLNRVGYHGLWRCNKKNGYNVPYGYYKNPELPISDMLGAAIKLTGVVTLVTSDFEPLIDQAGPEDVVYLDPPYAPLTATANFTSYTQDGFSGQDQIRLAAAARRAQKRGASVLISNHNVPWIRDLYAGAEIYDLGVRRNMAKKSQNRIDAPELLALFRG